MEHPIRPGDTRRILCTHNWDYLSAGQSYLATTNGTRTTRFDRVDGSSGTFLANWQVERGLQSGALVVEAAY